MLQTQTFSANSDNYLGYIVQFSCANYLLISKCIKKIKIKLNRLRYDEKDVWSIKCISDEFMHSSLYLPN